MPLLEITGIGGLSLQVYVGGVAKADIGQMNVDQQEIDRANSYHWEMQRGGLSQAPMANVVQSFLVTAENMPLQGN